VSTTSTTAFPVSAAAAAAAILHGTLTLTLENSATFTWTYAGMIARSDAAETYVSAGSKSLSAELDRVSIIGTTFDAGAINIAYE